MVNFEREQLINTLIWRFADAAGDVARVRLESTPFTALTRHEHHEDGVVFIVSRLGKAKGETWDFAEYTGYSAPHIHTNTAAELIVLLGAGTIFLDRKPLPYKAGDRFSVPAGMSHGFFGTARTVLLSIQSGEILNAETGEADVRPDTEFVRPAYTFEAA